MSRERFPPGPDGWAEKFSLHRRDPLSFLPQAVKDYGDVVGIRFFHHRQYFIAHPDAIADVLVNQAAKFAKGRVLRANRRLFGTGLLTSEGDLWLRQRRLAQPAFHRARVACYAETMVGLAGEMLATWKHGEKRDLHAEMMRLTLQIVGKTMFGVEVESEAEEVGKAIPALMKLNSNFRRLILIPSWLPTPVNLRAGLAVRRLHKIVDGIIARRRSSGEDKGDLLSTLIGARDGDGSQMDERQLRDEALTLFLAGHETTAVALSWTWWLLAQHARVEAELHAELDSVLAGRPPSLADLARLPVAERIVTEAMRLYPPAWGMARTAVEDVEVAGYRIPRGAGVSFAQWVVHRDARWYDAPEQFRPSRWEGDLARRIPRYAYFPFGGGPRQCIGNAFAMMEAVLLLCSISQRFRFRLLPEPPVVPVASITLRPRNGIPVEIEKRANLVRPA